MRGVNIVILGGNVGGDPDVKYLQDGGQVTSFSLAMSEKWKKDGEWKEKTEWIRIVCFRSLAETCAEYVKKGNPVLVIGKVRTRSWEDKEGNKRTVTEIMADKVSFLGGGSGEKGRGQEEEPDGPKGGVGDDVPF